MLTRDDAFHIGMQRIVDFESTNPGVIALKFVNGNPVLTGWEKGGDNAVYRNATTHMGVYKDAGSYTNDFGMTIRDMHAYGFSDVNTPAQLAAISPAQCVVLLREKFMTEMGLSKLPPQLIPQTIDYAIHMPGYTPRVLQNAMIDAGYMDGAATNRHALASVSDSLADATQRYLNDHGAAALNKIYGEARVAKYESMHTPYRKGFCNRARDYMRHCVKYYSNGGAAAPEAMIADATPVLPTTPVEFTETLPKPLAEYHPPVTTAPVEVAETIVPTPRPEYHRPVKTPHAETEVAQISAADRERQTTAALNSWASGLTTNGGFQGSVDNEAVSAIVRQLNQAAPGAQLTVADAPNAGNVPLPGKTITGQTPV